MQEASSPTRRWYTPQLRLRGMFYATTWMALCFYAWPVELRNVDTIPEFLFWAALKYVAPCIAVGALFGRAIYGAIAGVIGLLIWIGPGLLHLWDVI